MAGKQEKLLQILHKTLIIVLIFCFAWLSFDQVGKFLSGKTSVSTAFKPVEEYHIPTIIFCPERPILKVNTGVYGAYGYDQHEFEAYTMRPNVTFIGQTTWDTDYVNMPNRSFPLYTVFNGECLAFEFPTKLKHRKYLSFKLSGSYDIFLSKKKEEFRLVEQTFTPTSVGVSNLNSRKMTHYTIELVETQFRHRGHCLYLPEDTFESDCVLDQLAQMVLMDQNTDCVPIHYYSYLKDRVNLPVCNRTDFGHGMLNVSGEFLADPKLSEVCPQHCEKSTFSFRRFRTYYYYYPHENDSEDRIYDLFFTYPIAVVESHEEYLILDAPGIIASVGGGLGLFLGFSCLSSVKFAIEHISSKLF